MNQIDRYLEQCNIVQYVLRNSSALQGEVVNHIHEQIKLIVVAASYPTGKIYDDILSSIGLEPQNVLFVTPSQLIISAQNITHVIWFIDIMPPQGWRNYPLLIQTRSLITLSKMPAEKRQLWQQLCRYEYHFTTN